MPYNFNMPEDYSQGMPQGMGQNNPLVDHLMKMLGGGQGAAGMMGNLKPPQMQGPQLDWTQQMGLPVHNTFALAPGKTMQTNVPGSIGGDAGSGFGGQLLNALPGLLGKSSSPTISGAGQGAMTGLKLGGGLGAGIGAGAGALGGLLGGKPGASALSGAGSGIVSGMAGGPAGMAVGGGLGLLSGLMQGKGGGGQKMQMPVQQTNIEG